jgi:hypothetical protein
VRRPIVAALTLALAPTIVEACASCLDSASGNRSFNGAFVFLMLMPFAVAAVLVGVLAWGLGAGRAAPSASQPNEPSEAAGEGARAEGQASA